jgi:competence protein ComEA
MQDSGILQRISDSARASRSELGLIALLGVAVVGAGLVVVLRTSDPPAPPISKAVDPVPQSSAAPEPKSVLVHVTGQVRHPGVYELPEGSRINDAISAAGGPLEGADGNLLNLAAPVTDGQKITLTKTGETLPPEPPAAGANGLAPPQDAKVNLNTANQAQLEELPSVGPVLAQRILAHRQTKGRFTSVRQLMEVSGVGPKKFEALKDLVTI